MGRMRLITLAGLAAALAAPAIAVPADAPSAANAEPPAARPVMPAPLTDAAPDPAASASEAKWLAQAGRDYLNSGLPDWAARLLREAVNQPGLDAAERDALNLDLASAYLALNRTTEAADALRAVTVKTSAAYQLRQALLAARTGDWLTATGLHAQITRDALPRADRPWYHVVEAMLAEHRADAEAAQRAWENARDLANAPQQRAQFTAALWLSRQLYSRERVATEANALTLQALAERAPNSALGAQWAMQHALVLYDLNRREEALAVVNHWLQQLPDSDHASKNSLRLLAACFVPANTTPTETARGQATLRQVLLDRLEPGAPGAEGLLLSQELALTMMQNNLRDDRDRAALRDFLDVLIAQDHPLLKQILLLQTKLALALGQPDAAEKSAQLLLEKFPAAAGRRDPERENARWLLAYIALHRPTPQYRAAANALIDLRNELPPGPERAPLLGYLADLAFLDGDYQRAADAYAALLAEPDPPLRRGLLLRRAVDSALNAGRLAQAISILDAQAAQPGVDSLDRWHAEWNVLTALREHDDERTAFTRLDNLLQPAMGQPALPPELRLRLLWLAARLAAVDVGDASAIERARALREAVNALPAEGLPEISASLRNQFAAEALLLSYRAAHDAGKTDDANAFYAQLQERHPGSDAALYATFFRAEALYAQDKSAEAQGLMSKLADDFPEREFAPRARYRAAFYAIRRGQTSGYAEALELFEKFATTYPNHPLAYRARLNWADLNRRVLKFSDALRVYQLLLETFPNHELRPEAEMGRADSLRGLAASANGDARMRQDALDAYDRLVGLPGMPVDKSVEAGFKLGTLLASGDKDGKNRDLDAAVLAFTKVKNLYLNKDMVAQLAATTGGRAWMSQCLFYLADILEKQNKPDDARKIYQQVIDYNLDYASVAKQRLERAPGPAAPATPPSTTPARGGPAA